MTTEAQQEKDVRIERDWHRLFEIGVVLKGVNAALELLLGFVFLFVNVGALTQKLIQDALVEDPDNFLAHELHLAIGHVSSSAQYYSAFYLLSHGIIKLLLVWGLLKGKLWAYPASLFVLALFVAYQIIQFVATHSILMAALTIFDLIVMVLIYHEYRYVSSKRVLA